MWEPKIQYLPCLVQSMKYELSCVLLLNLYHVRTVKLLYSYISAIGLLGKPAEMYTHGTQFVAISLAYPIVMAVTAYMYWPVFFKLRVNTCYEVNKEMSRLRGWYC